MMCLQRIFALRHRCSCVRVWMNKSQSVFKNTNIHKKRRERQKDNHVLAVNVRMFVLGHRCSCVRVWIKKYSTTQIYTKEGEDNYVLAANVGIRTSLFVCTRSDEQPDQYSTTQIYTQKEEEKDKKSILCSQRMFVLGHRCPCVRVWMNNQRSIPERKYCRGHDCQREEINSTHA